MTTIAAFHTVTDSADPVYHDNSDCPYGREITRHNTGQAGTGGRRRCDWCSAHTAGATPLTRPGTG